MIRAQGLSKYYGGKRALGPVSFEITEGETIGFLGLNGAGKTTALRVLACDLRPSAGTVSIGDVDILRSPDEVRKRIGFLPESPPVYGDMVVNDYILFAGKLRGMSKADVLARIPKVLELTDLTDVRDSIIKELSHGYRQRVGVAQAIIHDPTLLILDEPTRGLDPVQIVEMRNMVNNLKEKHTVLISSHILTEISQTCDRLLVLGKGELIAQGTHGEIAKLVDVDEKPSSNTIVECIVGKTVQGDDSKEAIQKAVASVNSENVSIREKLGAYGFTVACDFEKRGEIVSALTKAGLDVLQVAEPRGQESLELAFLKLVKRGTHAND